MSSPVLRHPAYGVLRKAIVEKTGPLVLVVGSGLSTPAKLPNWAGLRKIVEHQLDELEYSNNQTGTPYDKGLFAEAHDAVDYWLFFKHAKKALTPATFKEIIRSSLDGSNKPIPPGYTKLLQLKPKGLVTLNLDRFAANAMAAARPGVPVAPIYGTELTRKWALLNDETPFLVYLHGSIDDSQTWVLDQDELKSITGTQAHGLFLSNLYLQNTVLFVGLSADDVALSAPLLTLRRSGFEPSKLFWLTTRQDLNTQKWAESNNIQILPYAVKSDDDHNDVINEIVEDIGGYRSLDEKKPDPLVGKIRIFPVPENNDGPDIVANLPPEAARKVLSNLISKRLQANPAQDIYDRFMSFVREYDYPIQTRAFYRSASANNFFDYKLNFPEMGIGNFGTVYQATSPSGSIVAVKVMHNNILMNEEMLGGFRRGSKSMQILTKNRVENVAHIIESFEMPPTIVMEFISGNSLSEIFDELKNTSWSSKVNMIRDVSVIVDNCHKLVDSVLHRDLKPSNVMIEGYDYSDHTYSRVVVLDFDMSWHKGSSEKDVVFESRDDFGYLSPEQTDPAGGAQSRSAKVDSYGLGMTAYAMFGGKHPIPNVPLDPRWADMVAKAAKQNYFGEWKCLPSLLSRAIYEATKVDHAERLEFSSLRNRFEKIATAANANQSIVPMDIAAEEVLCRVSGSRPYDWSDIADAGASHSVNGSTVKVWVDHDKSKILVSIEYVATGAQNYQNRDTLLADCRTFFAKELSVDEYYIQDISQRAGYLFVQFSLGGLQTLGSVEKTVALIQGGLKFINRI